MIYRRKNSRFWWCSMQVNGKRKWFSTGTENYADAIALASTMKARIKGGAREKLNRVIDAFFDEEDDSMGVALSVLPEQYLTLLQREGRKYSDKELRDRKSRLHKLSQYFPSRCVTDIDTPSAWEYISSLDCSAKSKRNIAGCLSSIWSTLEKFSLARTNPWKTSRPQRDPSTEKHGRAFTEDEVQAMVNAAPLWLKTEILIGIYTGLRPHDIRSLKWNNVDLRAKVISLTPSKTARYGIRVTIPIHKTLLVHLKSILKLNGKVVEASAHPDRDWKTLLNACGIKADKGERITSHCLRHTFATWIAKAGASNEALKKLGGWTVDKTVDVYNHHEDIESASTLVNSLPSIS